MRQGDQLITALKQALKSQGVTYRQIALELGLSEASIKRMLAKGELSLARLEAIAELAHCNLTDLLQRVQENEHKLSSLSFAQESEIASDLKLLLIAVSVISGFTFDDLKSFYQLPHPELIQKLAHLDRLQLIELQPGNRIKLRLSPNFHWQANGPIQKFFLEQVVQEFLASRFEGETERLLVFNGLCSSATNLKIQQRMQALVNEANELMKSDRNLGLTEKHGNTLVIALRQWQFPIFKQLHNPHIATNSNDL